MKKKLKILKELDKIKFHKVLKKYGEIESLKKLFIEKENNILKKLDEKTIKKYLKTDWRKWDLTESQYKQLNNLNEVLKIKYYEFYLEKAELTYSRKLNYLFVKENKINDKYFLMEPTFEMSLQYHGCEFKDEIIEYKKYK